MVLRIVTTHRIGQLGIGKLKKKQVLAYTAAKGGDFNCQKNFRKKELNIRDSTTFDHVFHFFNLINIRQSLWNTARSHKLGLSAKQNPLKCRSRTRLANCLSPCIWQQSASESSFFNSACRCIFIRWISKFTLLTTPCNIVSHGCHISHSVQIWWIFSWSCNYTLKWYHMIVRPNNIIKLHFFICKSANLNTRIQTKSLNVFNLCGPGDITVLNKLPSSRTSLRVSIIWTQQIWHQSMFLKTIRTISILR